MDLLVARTGLTLNPGQMADLVLAWRQLAGLIAAIPRSGALADDQAYVFRLSSLQAAAQPARLAPKREPVAKPKPAAKPKTVKKKSAAKPARKR